MFESFPLHTNCPLCFVAGFVYSSGMKRLIFKPTVSSSVAPNCPCVSLHPEYHGSFPHIWFTVCSLFFWVLRRYCHICLYDQDTKEINRKSMFSIFCESVFSVFELMLMGFFCCRCLIFGFVCTFWGGMFCFGSVFLSLSFPPLFPPPSLFLDRITEQLGV